MELQRQRAVALEGVYQNSIENKGKDAKATQELEAKLNYARAATLICVAIVTMAQDERTRQ